MNDICYVIGVKTSKTHLNEKDMSMKIMNFNTIRQFFSNIPVNPSIDVDKIEKELRNGGVSIANGIDSIFKIYTAAYIDAHDMNWTLKSHNVQIKTEI